MLKAVPRLSFMKTLKHEEVDGSAYRDDRHAKRQIASFIQQVYNRHRLHPRSTIDHRSRSRPR